MKDKGSHRHGAGLYDPLLSLPFISTIRRQEARSVLHQIGRFAGNGQTALEVGPGTGFYTLPLARAFRKVMAIEDSAAMSRILADKLAAAGVTNVSVAQRDFMALPAEEAFDVVMAIGVLDYSAQPAAFVEKMCSLARRGVILTVPNRGLWGACFAATGKLRGIPVYRYQGRTVSGWVPGWRCYLEEVGLKTRLTKGLTLVAALERTE